MNSLPQISQIILYPIKSLDGIVVSSATISPGGTLNHDRAFAIVDERGKVIRAKNTRKIHLLRTTYNLEAQTVTFARQGDEDLFLFHLHHERRNIEAWLSDFFGFRVYLIQNIHTGYPDDRHAWGPTLVSSASLEAVASWFPELSSAAVLRRFRPNLVIGGVPAFWEDRLFGEPGTTTLVQIGSVTMEGINPCARCVVPTRDPDTGVEYGHFQKTFVEQRRRTLPPWSLPSRFDHFYRFCVNTRIDPSESGKALQVGDAVAFDS